MRIPNDASQNVQAAFRDVEQEIEDLKARTASAPDQTAGADLSALLARIEQLEKRPRLNSDKDVFVASGPQHSAGLVPDPGDTAGTTAFLREDGTWSDLALETNQAYLGILPDEEQSSRGIDDVYQIPGSLHVAGSLAAGAINASVINAGDLRVNGGLTTTLYNRATTVTAAGGVETTASSVLVDLDRHMGLNGDQIIVETWIQHNQSAFTFNLYYGATTILMHSDLGFGGGNFTGHLKVWITRTGSAAQRIFAQVETYGTASGAVAQPLLAAVWPLDGTESNTGWKTIKTTLTDSNNDIREYACRITSVGAPG